MIRSRLPFLFMLMVSLSGGGGFILADWFKLEPSQGYIGTEVKFSGHSDTVRLQTVSLYWPSIIPGYPAGVIAGAFVNASGDFSGTFSVPYGSENGSYTVALRSAMWDMGSTSFTVGPPQGGFLPPPDVPAPSEWTLDQPVTSCRRLSMLGSTEGWACGGNEVWYFDGLSWNRHSTLEAGASTTWICMISPTDGWIGGSVGQMWHWDGTAWSLHSILPDLLSPGVISIHGLQPADVWAMGFKVEGFLGTRIVLFHFDGIAWSEAAILGDTALTAGDIKLVSPTDGWAKYTYMWEGKENKTVFYRYNGSTWALHSEQPACLFQMAAVSAGDIWAAGLHQDFSRHTLSLGHWDGGAWTITDTSQPVAVHPAAGFTSVKCGFADAGHGWAASFQSPSTLAKYALGAWSYQSLNDSVYAIWASDADDGWMIGGKGFYRLSGGSVLRLSPRTGKPGQMLTAKVSGFTPSTNFWLTWENPPTPFSSQMLEPVRTDAGGAFETQVYIPADASPGAHRFVLSTQQYVAGQGLRYAPVTYGQVTVRDGVVYAVAAPDAVYLRLGGWPGKDAATASTTLRARVSTMLPPAPADGLPMTAKVQSAPPDGCAVSPASGQTDGDGYFAFQVTPSEGDNLVSIFPTASPQDARAVRVVGYLQPPPPAELPPGFAAQAWVGTSGGLRQITLQPNWGPQGTEFAIRGSGFSPTQFAYAYWDNDELLGEAHTQSGSFSLDAEAPSAAGEHTVTVVTRNGDYATATFWVQNSAPDSTAPVVTIDYPPAEAVLSGTVTLQASATDTGGVQSMELRVGGTVMGRAADDSVSATWDTTLSEAGTYYITAAATDTYGNQGSATARVTVDNTGGDHLVPDVQFLNPADGTVVNGQVQVSVVAADNVGITQTAVFMDGARLIDTAQGGTLAFTLYANSYPNGVHTLDAVAYDGAGNTGRKSIDITIAGSSAGPGAPVITVTSPVAWGSTSGTITIQAAATDDGPDPPRLSAWLNGSRIANETDGVIHQGLNTAQYPSGLYNLTFFAVDSEGNTSQAYVPFGICNLARGGGAGEKEDDPRCHEAGPISITAIANGWAGDGSEGILVCGHVDGKLKFGFGFGASLGMGFGLGLIGEVDIKDIAETLLHHIHLATPPEVVNTLWNVEVDMPPPGKYTLEFKVTDAEGNSDSLTHPFTVETPPAGGCPLQDVSLTVNEYYQGSHNFQILVSAHLDPADEDSVIKVEACHQNLPNCYQLGFGFGEFELLWDVSGVPDGIYNLNPIIVNNGNYVTIKPTQVEVLNNSGAALEVIKLSNWPDSFAPAGGTARFPITLRTEDRSGKAYFLDGNVTVNSSIGSDRICLDGSTLLPLPQAIHLDSSDRGRTHFEIVAEATSSSTRTITATSGSISDSIQLVVAPTSSSQVNPDYAVDVNLGLSEGKLWVNGTIDRTDGGDVSLDLLCELHRSTRSTERFVQTGFGRWLDAVWNFEPDEGELQMTVTVTDQRSGARVHSKTFSFKGKGTPLESSVFSSGGFAFIPFLKIEPGGSVAGTLANSSYGLRWEGQLRAEEFPVDGLPRGLRDARVDWTLHYPDGTAHTGTAYSGADGVFAVDDPSPAAASPGVARLELRISAPGLAPAIKMVPLSLLPAAGKDKSTPNLVFSANAPCLICGTGRQLGGTGGRVLSNFPGGQYFGTTQNSGYVPVSDGDRLQLVVNAAALPEAETALRAVLQLGGQRQTLVIPYPEPRGYVLDFTVDLAAKSPLDLDTAPAEALVMASVRPAAFSAGVAAAAPVTLRFSRAVAPESLAYACVPDPGGWTAAWNGEHTLVTLSHAAFAAGTYYTFALTGAATPDGLPLAPGNVPETWTFTTAAGAGGAADNDGDGYVSTACGGDDSDDNDPEINPGQAEVRNGVDDNSNGLVDEGTDGVPPAPPADLSASYDLSTGVLQLHWTATGADGYVGAAAGYDLRYQTYALTESSWYTAVPLADPPVPHAPGTAENYTAILDLPAGACEFALRIGDAAGNWSALSNVARLEVRRPTVRVVTPAGGEVWLAGAGGWIEWTTGGDIGQLRIEYSPDGGESWQMVAGSVGNSGQYEWTGPAEASSCALVRVSELDGDPVGTSDCFLVVFPVDPDGDGEITADDLLLLGEYLAENLAGELEADLDGNGVVDVNDLLALTYLLSQ